ncbi:BolA family protein [Hyphomonas sp. FCG-A18]|uniref:BolA family protein n=1 Tax=Hyphomonas sp. FCG-A18 TaxID=3080019 RepID=UPI002B322394|nr:BolA family protein [Hyphomonas sp. FCG-A18]
MTRAQRIEHLLTQALSPAALEIIDDSSKHAGHAGARPEGETHYTVRIQAAAFEGLSRVAMQRAVLDALKPEFESGLHALSIKASTI